MDIGKSLKEIEAMANVDLMERQFVISNRINRGQDSYAGRSDAWHKLGTVTGTFNSWKELLVAAKADFEVEKNQLEYQGKQIGAWGTFRKDNGAFLGTVGGDYQVIQHTEGFGLLDELVGQVDGAHYETMGTLDFGKVVWGQVDPNLSIHVGDDESKIFLSFVTSHDGSKAFDIYETAVRQVCHNTVRAGQLKKLANTLRVKHTKHSAARIKNLTAEIQEIRTTAMSMQERLQFLVQKKVTKASLQTIMERLFPTKKTENGEESSTRRDNNIAEILGIYEDNDGNAFPEQRGTAYNLLNAFTNYTDHVRTSRNGLRAQSAVFGSGDKFKLDAMSAILLEAKTMPDMIKQESIPAESLGLRVR